MVTQSAPMLLLPNLDSIFEGIASVIQCDTSFLSVYLIFERLSNLHYIFDGRVTAVKHSGKLWFALFVVLCVGMKSDCLSGEACSSGRAFRSCDTFSNGTHHFNVNVNTS